MTDKKLFGIGGGSGRLNWQKSEKTYNSKILKYTQLKLKKIFQLYLLFNALSIQSSFNFKK